MDFTGFLNSIRGLEVFYVTFGAFLGWLLTVSKDSLIRQKEKKEVLIGFHKEVQFYRNSLTLPGLTDKTNTINMWPEISPSFVLFVLQNSIVSARKDGKLFSHLMELIRDIEFYHSVMKSAYMGFVSRFCSQQDVYNALCPSLIKIKLCLQKIDILLMNKTKMPHMEIPLDEQLISAKVIIENLPKHEMESAGIASPSS
jgi:hypothetical protein